MLKELNKDDRPRERLINKGVKSLSDQELISLLLKEGIKNIDVKELANNILKEYNINDLRYVTLEQLLKIKGIGISKASTILAAIEFEKQGEKEFRQAGEILKLLRSQYGAEAILLSQAEDKNLIIVTSSRVKLVRKE